jgi:hypothetical protein
MKCGCVFWEFAKRNLATRKDKIKIIKSLPLALSVVRRDARCLLATELFNKHLLAILNETSNPIGLHNEYSLFQRISYLSSRLTDNASGKLLIIFILSHLFVLPSSFLQIHKTHNLTSLQVWNTNVLQFCSFCKPTFSGATREWDALYFTLIIYHQCTISFLISYLSLRTRYRSSAQLKLHMCKRAAQEINTGNVQFILSCRI